MRSLVNRLFAVRRIQLNVCNVHIRSESPLPSFASLGIFLVIRCIFKVDGQRIAILSQVGLDVFVHVVVCLVFRLTSRKSKITDLGSTFHVYEDVGRLDIAMHDISRVHKVHRAQQIVHQDNHVLLRKTEALACVKHLLQITFLELHHNEDVLDRRGAFWIEFRRYHIKDSSRVTVFFAGRQFSHDLDFANKFFSLVLILETILEKFDCDISLGLAVACLHDAAKGALTKAFEDLIVFDEAVPNCLKVVLVGVRCALRELTGNTTALSGRPLILFLSYFERFHISLILKK